MGGGGRAGTMRHADYRWVLVGREGRGGKSRDNEACRLQVDASGTGGEGAGGGGRAGTMRHADYRWVLVGREGRVRWGGGGRAGTMRHANYRWVLVGREGRVRGGGGGGKSRDNEACKLQVDGRQQWTTGATRNKTASEKEENREACCNIVIHLVPFPSSASLRSQ